MSTTTLLGLTLDELTSLVQELGEPKYRAKQLAEWLYVKRATTLDEMTNLPKALRSKLKSCCTIGRSPVALTQVSRDGTEKYLFRRLDRPEQTFETVYIPEEDGRATLCISSQVGCRMGCRFCATGQMGFHGHLTAADVINQVLSVPHSDALTNVVFMGMGEPLDNYKVVASVLEIMTSDYGLAWSPKRITVSTVGPRVGLTRFLDEQRANLAVSLHSPFPEERAEIMPVEGLFPIDEVIETLVKYDFSGQRRLSFEYIVFGGLNDDLRHAKALVELIRPLRSRVNLIPYHPIDGLPYHASDRAVIERFAEYLNAHGVIATIRRSRGQDIDAACGMLSTLKPLS
ncbi:23S rRNA (adenine(2503)-C(2))-methyltransferase RlmN [uncultured Porphyromonas sp.]|uniref:23S rRNA (adenine(2503)-C(2))-methyltransferase RlmN n=1 Tax=uncultured Porphyromonas sp. TaxID=159274 RepID=UPI002593A1D4|nr:23S rRNA (adenine(2503)-C(2))-methyltransferase RlmN [uncultured Porphyromonas sp.]